VGRMGYGAREGGRVRLWRAVMGAGRVTFGEGQGVGYRFQYAGCVRRSEACRPSGRCRIS